MTPSGRKKWRCEAAEVAVELDYPLAAVCRVLGGPRSTVYHRRTRSLVDVQVIPYLVVHGIPWWPAGVVLPGLGRCG